MFESIEVLTKGLGRIPLETMIQRDREAFRYPLKCAAELVNKYRGCKAILAGGGPSLNDTFKDIRQQLKLSKKTYVVGLNRTEPWLRKKGIKPDFGMLIDPKPWVKNYIVPMKGTKYVLGAKLHPDAIKKFFTHDESYLFHPLEHDRELSVIESEFPHQPRLVLPGQSTVGLRAIPLFYQFGFRRFELHGYDCNLTPEGNSHAYSKFTEEERVVYNPERDLGFERVVLGKPAWKTASISELMRMSERDDIRVYGCTRQMARQIEQFEVVLKEFDSLEKMGYHQPSDIRVAGHGALPWLAAKKYGLHVNEEWNAHPERMPYNHQHHLDYMKEIEDAKSSAEDLQAQKGRQEEVADRVIANAVAPDDITDMLIE